MILSPDHPGWTSLAASGGKTQVEQQEAQEQFLERADGVWARNWNGKNIVVPRTGSPR